MDPSLLWRSQKHKANIQRPSLAHLYNIVHWYWRLLLNDWNKNLNLLLLKQGRALLTSYRLSEKSREFTLCRVLENGIQGLVNFRSRSVKGLYIFSYGNMITEIYLLLTGWLFQTWDYYWVVNFLNHNCWYKMSLMKEIGLRLALWFTCCCSQRTNKFFLRRIEDFYSHHLAQCFASREHSVRTWTINEQHKCIIENMLASTFLSVEAPSWVLNVKQ